MLRNEAGATRDATRETRESRDPSIAVLLAVCLGALVAQVDSSVVNLGIAPIEAAFHVPVASLQWVLDAYNLTYAVFLLSAGLAADLIGRKRVFMAGAAVMVGASLACALAPNVGVLIAGRAVAGLAAALLVPASLAIIRVAWSEDRARGRVLGVWASCNGLAFVIGPVLGGGLIDHFGWRSVFLLAIPFAAAALALGGGFVIESTDPEGRHLDAGGQLLGALALGALAFAAIMAHAGGWAWIAALCVAAVALPLFLLVERKIGAGALVPLTLFHKSTFCGASVATWAMTFGIYGVVFLLPFVWQSSGVFGAEAAGLALVPMALVFFLVAPRSGPLAERIGRRAMAAGGTAFIGFGLMVVAMTEAARPLWLAEVGLVLAGLGMGLNTGPLMAVAVGAVERARSGTASAVINAARMSGATLGVAVLGTIFAVLGGSIMGLRAAMLLGGAIELAGAVIAWATISEANADRPDASCPSCGGGRRRVSLHPQHPSPS